MIPFHLLCSLMTPARVVALSFLQTEQILAAPVPIALPSFPRHERNDSKKKPPPGEGVSSLSFYWRIVQPLEPYVSM
jgi:hypothetical protein